MKSRLRGVVVIAGVGNVLRGDDGAGPRLVEMLEKRLERATEDALCVRVINCGQAPENHIGSTRKMRPDTIIVVDSASLGLPAGDTRILEVDDLGEHSFSTQGPASTIHETSFLTMSREVLFLKAGSLRGQAIPRFATCGTARRFRGLC